MNVEAVALAPVRDDCRVTVVIPARDESAAIGAALGALNDQRDFDGRRLSANLFDVLVFANNCSDRTAAVARAFAATARMPISIVERDLPVEHAHIGAARKYVMDIAAQRFLRAGRPQGIIASTDSDTVVDARWIAWILRESCAADAVAGHVTIADADQARMLAPVRQLYARELTYRRLVAEVEALLDPVPEDPLPRHCSFVGASFAVSARVYIAAGALPPLPRLEDLHFRHALRRVDARIRHSPFVRAATSARVSARVSDGFGAFIAELHRCAERGVSFRVEHPQQTIEALELRAMLRRLWQTNAHGAELTGLRMRATRLHPDWARFLACAPTFGRFAELVTAALHRPSMRCDSPVDVAIERLRARLGRPSSVTAGAGTRVHS